MEFKLISIRYCKLKRIQHFLMRLSLILLCISLSSFKIDNTLAQTRVNIEHDKEATIDEIFELIINQTDYKFLYPQDLFSETPKVKLKKGSIRVDKLLNQSIPSEKFNLIISNQNTIVIKKKNDKLIQQQVSGVILDEGGLPIEGVTIIVKGTTIGTISDFEGNYSIQVPYPDNILVFSYLGLETQEIQVNSNTSINITLKKSNEKLDEVVLISDGYQKIPKERATGSFSSINEDAINQRITTNLTDRLEGLTTGLTVKQDGKIEIRGQGTFYGETNPLLVVDGFPIESNISTINPSDIETITVLKDAAAASIYGAQAANGVIVITTKQAKKNGGLSFNASMYSTITSKGTLDALQHETAAARIELEIDANEGGSKSYRTSPQVFIDAVAEAMIRYDINGLPDYPQEFAYTLDQRNNVLNELSSRDAYAQFEKYLMRNAIQNQYNISMSQGGEKNNFYGSLAYNTDQSTSVGNSNDRFVINLKNSYELTKKINFQLGANIVYNSSEENSPLIVGDRLWNFYFKRYDNLVDESGSRIGIPQINFTEYRNREALGYLPYTTNHLDVLDANDNTTVGLATRLNASLNIELLDGLVFNTKFQYEKNYSKAENHLTINNPKWSEKLNAYTIYDETTGNLTYNLPFGDRLIGSNAETNAWIARNQLSFNKSYNDKHSISAIAGMEVRRFSTVGNSYNVLGYDENTLTSAYTDLNAIVIDRSIRNWWGSISLYQSDIGPDRITNFQKRDVSYYGNASYVFNNKYVFNASGRLDQANIFGLETSARDNFLWSSGFSWALSRENFFDVSWVDKLNLRATYGVNGNRPAPGQTSYLTGTVGVSQWVPKQNAITLTNPANLGLRSEKVKALNLAVDYSLFGSRINGSLEYYQKNSSDLIGPKQIDPTNGWASGFVNYAELQNTGIELNFNAKIIQSDQFNWNAGLNFSKNTNKITDVDLSPTTAAQLISPFNNGGYLIKGDPIGRMYGYKYAGLGSNGEPQIYDSDGSVIGWKEAYSRGYDETILHNQGTSIAPYYGGLINTFNYKNFRLDVLFTYKFGHKMKAPRGENDYALYTASYQTAGNWIEDRWRQPGDEAFTDVPQIRPYYYDSLWMFSYYKNSDINILDASHVRLTDVNLSYNINSFFDNSPFSDLTISAQGKNLWLWTANNDGIDPEANFDSILFLPRTKSVVFGIKASF